jgi:Secretion system C-terminal sorting domain/Kre9/KNH-like N-terminal Ig-like domain
MAIYSIMINLTFKKDNKMKKLIYSAVILVVFLLAFENSKAVKIYDVTPAGGENITQMTTVDIEWLYPDSTDNVNIYLWDGTNASWSTIATNVSAVTGSYSWNIGSTSIGTSYRFKVESVNDDDKFNMSTGYINIVPPSSISSTEESNETKFNLTVFPNPVQDMFTVSVENTKLKAIAIWNIKGERVAAYQVGNLNSFDIQVDQLQNGEYLIECSTSSNDKLMQKIIVNK